MTQIKEWDSTYVAHTYGRFPISIVEGKGSILKDENGKEYIDLGSGIAVNTFGVADDVWINAVNTQMQKLSHTSNLYYTEPCAKLAKILCERTGMKKVFFSNSGAESNECAIKAARKYAAETLGKDNYYIITLKGSFHGRTITTLSATGQDVFHNQFQPLTSGFLYAEPNNVDDIEKLLNEYPCAAVMLEPIQGEGGVNALDFEYLKAVEKLAKEHNALLIVDEVQSGNGRSGKLFAYMNSEIHPDIITTAKGLGGGLPIGATLFNEKTADVYKPGDHGSTFGGNPICCAGAISVVERLDDAFLNEVQKKADYIWNSLETAKGIKSISGLGLMIGIETERDSSQVLNECMENGVLVLKAKNKIRLLPPLNIPNSQLKKAIEILKTACAKV